MIKLLAMAGLAALVTACAAPPSSAAADPMQSRRGSTPAGASKAADLGFHGPVYRSGAPEGPDGPN